MKMIYDDNDDAIAAAARSLLSADPPIAAIRSAQRTDMLPDADRWQRYADQGWFGLSLPEELGGVGYGLAQQAVLLREIGYALAPGPIVATTVAARAAAMLGDAALAGEFVTGDKRAAFIVTDGEETGPRQAKTVPIVDGVGADYFVAFTTTDVLFFDADDADVVGAQWALDPGSRILTVRPVVCEPVFKLSGSAAARARAEAELLSAAVLCGIAAGALDMSVAYVKLRTQFDVPIGTFQAVQHRCAYMAAKAEAARCQTLFAALALDASADVPADPDSAFSARAALAVATKAAMDNGDDNMSNHAAIGMTYEHDAHLFVTRARTVAGALGTSHARLRHLAEAPAPSLAGIH